MERLASVDCDALGPEELLHPSGPELAAETALLPPAEGSLGLTYVMGVDPDITEVERFRDAVRAVDVGGPDRCSQPVTHPVGDRDGFRFARTAEGYEHRSEELLL